MDFTAISSVLAFFTAHPEHAATITSILAILHDDPTFIADLQAAIAKPGGTVER